MATLKIIITENVKLFSHRHHCSFTAKYHQILSGTRADKFSTQVSDPRQTRQIPSDPSAPSVRRCRLLGPRIAPAVRNACSAGRCTPEDAGDRGRMARARVAADHRPSRAFSTSEHTVRWQRRVQREGEGYDGTLSPAVAVTPPPPPPSPTHTRTEQGGVTARDGTVRVESRQSPVTRSVTATGDKVPTNS